MKRKLFTGLLTLLLILSLAACGGSGSASSSDSAAMDMGDIASSESVSAQSTSYGAGSGMYEAEEEDGGEEIPQATERKFIITARLELETTSFDEAVRGLSALTEEFDGWYENSSVANRTSGSRWAEYTVRIPAARYEDFLNQAGTLCHETWREATQDEITEAYYDTQGRLKTQQIKLERLQALLERAEVMEDIITIESAISETEWQIDELSGTLRHYDSKVDYATVYINLQEVYRLSNVEEVPETFGDRMGVAFTSGLRSFSDSMENLAVGLAYSWMWWLLLAVVAAVVFRLLRRQRKADPEIVRKPPFWSPRVEKSEDDKSGQS